MCYNPLMVNLIDVRLLLVKTQEKLGNVSLALAEIELRRHLETTGEELPTDSEGRLLYLKVTHAKSQVILAQATRQTLEL